MGEDIKTMFEAQKLVERSSRRMCFGAGGGEEEEEKAGEGGLDIPGQSGCLERASSTTGREGARDDLSADLSALL